MKPFNVRGFLRRYWGSLVPVTIPRESDFIAERATGSTIFDVCGEPRLDFSSQVGIALIGHRHPLFVEGWKRFLEGDFVWSLIASDFHFSFKIKVGGEWLEISQPALAEALRSVAFGKDTKFIQQVTGVLINNVVTVKFVPRITKKHGGIAFFDAFHGRQWTALAATMSKSVQRQGYLLPGGMYHLPFPQNEIELDYCYKMIAHWPLEDIGFVIFELVQGEGGINPATPHVIELLHYLQELGVLLVDDEIQTGLGRTGTWFAYEHFGIVPDIVTISKALGSVTPVAAAFFDGKNPRLRGWEKIPVGWDSSTFQWVPEAVLSAILVLHILKKENLVKRAAVMGEYLEKTIDEVLAKFFPSDAVPRGLYAFRKGLGLHQGIEFRTVLSDLTDVPNAHFRDCVLRCLLKHGILTLGAGNVNVRPSIRLMPPLVITDAEIDQFGLALEASFKESLYSTKA